MQFTEDRGRPTYKMGKEPDMTLLNPPSHKFHLRFLWKMAQALQADSTVIVSDDVVSSTSFDGIKACLNVDHN
jgi:hypothetical protein